jgi:ferredoxin
MLLDATRQAGLPVAAGCGSGQQCALCGLEILEGESSLARETEDEALLKRLNRIDEQLRLSCQLEVKGNLVVTAQYW